MGEDIVSDLLGASSDVPGVVEPLVLSVDFTSPELLGEDKLSVPCVPLGVVSVVVVPPVVLPEVPAGELVPVPLEQAPKNASPNTSEKAANVRLTMISPKICKIFCMESGLLTPALE